MNANAFRWPNGQKCAVSLTYDDALPVHYETVAPLLQQAGIVGTFYIPIRNDPLRHPQKWRELADHGHELGNHTLFHPCRRTPERHAWLAECYDLNAYTPERFRLELEIANLVLHLIDGKTERSYGNTCCETTLGRGDQETPLDGILSELFIAARGPFNSKIAVVRSEINLMQVGHYGADGRTFDDVQGEIERAAEIGGWIVYMLHGVGQGTHGMYMDASEHEKLISWLGANKDAIWTAPFIDVASFVKQQLP